MNFWNFTRSPASVRLLLEFGRRRGLAATQLLAGTRLTQAQLDNAQVSLSPGKELAVIANLLRFYPASAGLGLQLGLGYRLSAYGVLGLGMMSSATALDALRLAQRFLPLTYSYAAIVHRRDGELDTLLFEPPLHLDAELQQFVVERAMGATVRVLSDITGVAAPLKTMRLRGDPASVAIRNELVKELGCAPRWQSSEDLVAIPRVLTGRALPQANAMTAAMCERMCEELVEQRRTRLDTPTLVREYLAAAPDACPPRLADVAAFLCTSERSLKRWFHDDGTSFRELLEESRRAKADRWLSHPHHSLSEVAERLGFSDLSSFSQAYKRWTGTAPSLSPARGKHRH
ncbi:AraC-type DNA-binding protein [Dyella jiangningensis]|uniref:helix-turn-helix transcriptional regulator n=1 Tax=Dyella sp. AtDHG13 TaxID=1938897 RepID=UPI00089194BA|nr:AraC family transcriptional regulator [Dyella sp. AtDHG13]PXV58779.1 AraC-like DNA-binding protein [Dyella sp. AtDHG13]SDJ82787.1 AraC-type DNA-binding protein [Dyella jiangningensis]